LAGFSGAGRKYWTPYFLLGFAMGQIIGTGVRLCTGADFSSFLEEVRYPAKFPLLVSLMLIQLYIGFEIRGMVGSHY
jgi:hypothetical protein